MIDRPHDSLHDTVVDAMRSDPAVLPVYVVYKNPSDYPGKFVVRVQWACSSGAVRAEAEPRAVGDSYFAVVAAIPCGLYNLGRQPGDDPTILEVWL